MIKSFWQFPSLPLDIQCWYSKDMLPHWRPKPRPGPNWEENRQILLHSLSITENITNTVNLPPQNPRAWWTITCSVTYWVGFTFLCKMSDMGCEVSNQYRSMIPMSQSFCRVTTHQEEIFPTQSGSTTSSILLASGIMPKESKSFLVCRKQDDIAHGCRWWFNLFFGALWKKFLAKNYLSLRLEGKNAGMFTCISVLKIRCVSMKKKKNSINLCNLSIVQEPLAICCSQFTM